MNRQIVDFLEETGGRGGVQLTGFYMMGTLVVKRLREERLKPILLLVTHKKADRPCLKFSLKPNICLQQVSRSPISKSTLS